MRTKRKTIIDTLFFDFTLVVILLILSTQSQALPSGYSWTQLLNLETKANRLADIMFCSHPQCTKQIGTGPKNQLNFSARGQGTFNSLATWKIEDLTDLEVSNPKMQLCEKNPGDIPYYSSFQAEGKQFAFYQNSDSFDFTDDMKLMSSANHTYSKALRPRPWSGTNSSLLLRTKLAIPEVNYDEDNVKTAIRVVIKVGYNNPNHPAHKKYFWLKPQFYASHGTGPTDNVRVDPNTSILMAKAFIKRNSKYIKVTNQSHLMQKNEFLNQKLFEFVVEKVHLKRIIEDINTHPSYDGVEFPKGNSHWQHYEVKGFSINQETNLDSQDTGRVHDFESALKVSLFEAYIGSPL